MAIDLETSYPANVDPATPDYPFGVPRNVSSPGAGDGTPWEEAVVRDIYGFFAAMLQGATPPIAPSLNADTAQASDYLDALKSILLQRSELVENGGDIVTRGQSLHTGAIYGLRNIWNTTAIITVNPGGARSAPDMLDLVLDLPMQKDITATWVQGTGNGGRPASVPLTPGTWYRLFLVAKPDGSEVDLVWDTTLTAAQFFANEGAAAGYADPLMYRRIGWTRTDGGSQIQGFYSPEADPREIVWDVMDRASILQNAGTRQPVSVLAPPNTLVKGYAHVTGASAEGVLYVTSEGQADVAAGVSENYTVYYNPFGLVPPNEPYFATYGEWDTNSASQLFGRVITAFDAASLAFLTRGYRDPALSN